MIKYFLSKKLFSNEYQYFILELFLNILNYYYNDNLYVFFKHLCRNVSNRVKDILRETQATESNLNLYIDNKKLLLFNTRKEKEKSAKNIYGDKILNLFKYFIIYFYNIFLRTNEKQYFGCMVDLIKFFVNDQQNCADFLIEEFCNNHTIVEYLINCPLYDIKKIIVGIIYCAMIKSVNSISSVKENQNQKVINENNNKNNIYNICKNDEEIARQLQYKDNNNLNYYDNNPLDYKNIPKNILKMIYNILHLIRDTKYNRMNEYRFLFFTIYRFSLISQITREFLIYKCRLFELLCLLLHKNHQQLENYKVNEIIISTYMGPYTVTHNILNEKINEKEKKELNIIEDKVGIYRNENYLYMLFFYLLSFKPPKGKKNFDPGYSLENIYFINVLLNNIRTKQDAFCFINFIIEKSDKKEKIKNVYEALFNYLEEIDNNDKINYDYNNYNNFVDNNMNENPNQNDPGINPKYLVLIIKKFIISLLNKEISEHHIKKVIKKLFELFYSNQKCYSYSIMIIDLLLDLFSTDLKKFRGDFAKDFSKIRDWLEKWSIPPIKYDIDGIFMYKKMKINFNNNLSEKEKEEFNLKELYNTQKKIDLIYEIFKEDNKNNNNKSVKDIDVSDFRFIIGDIIFYQGKDSVIEEALDEQLKISFDNEPKNSIKKNNDKKEIWIEIDNPTIEIKELKEK